MSGFEIAGLVLSALPIVLSTLNFYISTLDDLRHHQKVLQEFKRELDMELCLFHNTCLSLFEDTMTIQEIALLMNNQGTEKNQKLLETRLRPHAVPHFNAAMDRFRELIEDLGKVFEPVEDTSKKSKKKVIKRMYKKYTPVLLKKYCQEQLSTIRNINESLERLANGGIQSTEGLISGGKVPSKAKLGMITKFNNRVRSHAILLYGLFREKFHTPNCNCSIPHIVSLELEKRDAKNDRHPGFFNSESQRHMGQHLRFKFLFSFDPSAVGGVNLPSWKCRELELQYLEVDEFSTPEPLIGSGDHNIASAVCATPSANTAADTEKNVMPAESPNEPSTISNALERVTGYLLSPRPLKNHRPRSPGSSEQPKIKKQVGFAKMLGFGRSPSPNPCLSTDVQNTGVVRPVSPLSPPPSISGSPAPDKSNDRSSDNSTTITVEVERNLCVILRGEDAINLAPCACLGILVDQSARKHSVWLPTSPSPTYLFEVQPVATISLEMLMAAGHDLSRKERLTLAVKLASSVIQLHNTEWLNEGWGKGDILFLTSNISGSGNRSLLEKPMIRRCFNTTTPLSPAGCEVSRKSHVVGCNKTLFSLGIILLELWFWKKLVESPTAKTNQDKDGKPVAESQQQGWMDPDTRAYIAAQAQLEELREDALPIFTQAVRACISGLTHIHERSLENNEFKQEVWKMVVCPLEEVLTLWS